MATGSSLADLFPSRPPQLNHVAMSMAATSLDKVGRRDIIRFYGDVFGWRYVPMTTNSRQALVMSTTGFDQFIYLIADEHPMSAPRMDHFGMSVGTLDELRGVHARACAYRERDPRVDVIDPAIEDHKVLRIHNMYVSYLLPLMIEIQFWEFDEPRN